MKSKEALNKLFFDNKDIQVDITLNDRKVCEIYNTFKQDLDKLEKLEKAIKILKNTFKFEIDEECETIYCCLNNVSMSRAEINKQLILLKEVLEDEI